MVGGGWGFKRLGVLLGDSVERERGEWGKWGRRRIGNGIGGRERETGDDLIVIRIRIRIRIRRKGVREEL